MANNQFKLVPVDYSKPYDEQLDCKRHVIGAYANLARHNMTVTINVIMQAIGMELFNENDIDDAFNKNHRKKLLQLDNIQKVNLQKRLYRHFPFFKRMKLEDETKKSVQLNTLLEVMADFTNCMAMLRNLYTHYHPYNSPKEEERQLEQKKAMGKRLQHLYENTSQMFKSNESIDHESNEVFAALRMPVDYIEEIKEEDKDYKKLFNLINDPQTPHYKKRGLKLNRETGIITRQSIKFIRNPKYQAYMMDENKGMSDIAIIYFLCLFLEKKVSFELMDEVGLAQQIQFKGKNADQQLLYVKEILCMNRIRMTKTKLDSEMTDTALALDMINELRKCPKPLYEVLSKDARDEFKDDSTVLWEKKHGKEAVDTEDKREDEEDTSEKSTPRSTFVRWEDRFPQMALRYIDLKGKFEDIRFHLNLGKYRFAFYQHDKQYSIDNEERLRILQKELHGFGRIQEVEAKKNEKWAVLFDEKYVEEGLTKKKPDEAGQAPYVTEQKAQYAIDEKSHSIGLRWEGWKATGDSQKHYGDLDNQKMFIPYLPTKPLQEEKQTNQSEPLLPPQAMLSIYELPALLFYQYLIERNGQDCHLVESVIKECYKHLKDFFTDVSVGKLLPLSIENGIDLKEELGKILQEKYELRLSDVPEKLRKYLLSVCVDYEKKLKDSAYYRLEERKKRVIRMLDSYHEKVTRIGTKDNKFDKMRATIKTGSLAQALMRDIMDWLPQDTESRVILTGQSYMALQTAIAMLGQKFENESGQLIFMSIDRLKRIMIKAKITEDKEKGINQSIYHPFLHLVFRDCKEQSADSIEKFYELYLEREIEKINLVKEYLDKASGSYASLYERYRYVPFLHHERIRWSAPNEKTMKDLAAHYLERPLQLPDGLFTNKIYQSLRALPQQQVPQKRWDEFQNLIMKAGEGEKHLRLSRNVSYLINLYFENVEGDHAQPFYFTFPIEDSPSPYRHVYRVFKKYFGEPIPRTNQTTSPAYSTEKIHEILKDKNNLDFLILNHIANEVAQFKEKKERKIRKFNLKKFIGLQWTIVKEENESGKVRRNYQQRQEEVNRRVKEKKEEIERLKLDVEKETREYKDSLIKKEKRQFQKVANNERTIRRFKTQDMLLFIMAREILKAKNHDSDIAKDFCLKYVMFDSLLDKPINFEWKVNIERKKKNNEGKIEKEIIPKTIRQEEMKMKNYGQFFKFASDHQRLESLLSRLPQDIFLRAEIENEFSYYDTNRSEVFRQVYIIESEAYKLKPELENDANVNEEWFFFVDKKGKKHPKRNNFLSLLEILAAGIDGILDEEEKKAMQTTRNAFGHNTYDVDFDHVFEGKEKKKKIPEVSNGITEKLKEETEKLKKKLEE